MIFEKLEKINDRNKARIIIKSLLTRSQKNHRYAGLRYAEPPTGSRRFRKAERARSLLETAKALAKARPGADASDFAAAATALADGHPSQAVRGLAAQFEASLPTAAPVKKPKKKRKTK